MKTNTLVLVIELNDEQEAQIMASLPENVTFRTRHESCGIHEVAIMQTSEEKSLREAYRIVDSLRRFINPYPGKVE